MKIKSMIAGLLAGVLMMGNLSAVCFAAEGAPAPTSGDVPAEAVETAPAGTDGATEDGDAGETEEPEEAEEAGTAPEEAGTASEEAEASEESAE